jgi:hypothetical protein
VETRSAAGLGFEGIERTGDFTTGDFPAALLLTFEGFVCLPVVKADGCAFVGAVKVLATCFGLRTGTVFFESLVLSETDCCLPFIADGVKASRLAGEVTMFAEAKVPNLPTDLAALEAGSGGDGCFQIIATLETTCLRLLERVGADLALVIGDIALVGLEEFHRVEGEVTAATGLLTGEVVNGALTTLLILAVGGVALLTFDIADGVTVLLVCGVEAFGLLLSAVLVTVKCPLISASTTFNFSIILRE